MDDEIRDLRFRLTELEQYLDDYHDMLEDRLQWQAERVVSEILSVTQLLLIIPAIAGVAWLIGEWNPGGGIINAIVSTIAIFTVWIGIAMFFDYWREQETPRLPRPWIFVQIPHWRKKNHKM